LPGEKPDEVALCAEIAGDDGAKIDIRVLVCDILQGQPHELCVPNDDIGPFRDQLFRIGNCDVRSDFLSVDIIYIRILFGDSLPGAVVGTRPGGPLDDAEMLDGQCGFPCVGGLSGFLPARSSAQNHGDQNGKHYDRSKYLSPLP
jgi:hypothetical protein